MSKTKIRKNVLDHLISEYHKKEYLENLYSTLMNASSVNKTKKDELNFTKGDIVGEIDETLKDVARVVEGLR
jgi:hypothetical protein